MLRGTTRRMETPLGTMFVTITEDDRGQPFEVFITAPGKAGSDLQADAEGLGRMISLQLRTTAPQKPLAGSSATSPRSAGTSGISRLRTMRRPSAANVPR